MDCKRCGLPFTERYPEWKDYRTHGSVEFCLSAHQCELDRLKIEVARLKGEHKPNEPWLLPEGQTIWFNGEAIDPVAEIGRLREACERALTGLHHHSLCATQPPNHSAYCDCGVTGTQRLLKLALEGCRARQERVKKGVGDGQQ